MELINYYTGPLKNPNDIVDPIVKQAYISWREQRTRCYNKKREKYKNYGAKGVEVKYSSREFIGWWISEIKSFSGKRPTIGRINHDGHYEFGNVTIQDVSENSTERNDRVGPLLSPRAVFSLNENTNEKHIFKSMTACARFYKIRSIYLHNLIKEQKQYSGFRFFCV